MPDKWTGKLVGRMHNAKVTLQDLADELGCTKGYTSMVLNGTRKPKEAQERFTEAFEAIISRRGISEEE